jgi:hypothetical protein
VDNRNLTIGNYAYPNSNRQLARLPDSPVFHFGGTPEPGLTIARENNLTVRISRLRITWTGSAYCFSNGRSVLSEDGRKRHRF